MRKINVLLMILLIINLFTLPVHANTVECSYTLSGRQVVLTGNVEGANQICEVTLLVGTEDNILYLNQVSSDTNGDFEFKFNIPENLPYGEYTYAIGSNMTAEAYRGIINYVYIPPKVERTFLDGIILVNISNYVPSISGNISCINGKYTQFKVTNITDNTIIAENNITSSNGQYNLECTLPSLLSNKEYNIQIKSVDGEQQLVYIDVTIDSSILLLDVSGTVEVGEGVRLDTELNTVNFDLLQKSSTITTNKSVSLTIPNLVSNMLATITIRGTETIPDPEEVPEENEKGYVQISTDKEYAYTLDENKKFLWFSIKPKYTGKYLINLSEGISASLYKNSNGIISYIGSNEAYLSYPNEYYLQISADSGVKNLSFSIDNAKGKADGKIFEILMGTDKYFTNTKDAGKLYKNEMVIESVSTLKGALWLCGYKNYVYFNHNNTLHRITDNVHEIVDTTINAKYIVADESNIYFSNWSDSGKLYRGYLNDDNTMTFEKMCNDIVSWITVEDDYIYYKNNLNRNQVYRVLKTAANLVTGEKAE